MGDIFSPAYCDRDLNYFNTQHDINNWFWKQIKSLKCCCDKANQLIEKHKNLSDVHFSELDKITTKLSLDVADIYKTLSELKEADKLMRSDFITFTVEVNKTLDLYRSDINKLEELTTKQNGRLNNHDSEFNNVYNKISELKSLINDYDFNTIIEQYKRNEKRFEETHKRIDLNRTNIGELNTKLNTEISERQLKDTELLNKTQSLREDLNNQINNENKHHKELKNEDKRIDNKLNTITNEIKIDVKQFKDYFYEEKDNTVARFKAVNNRITDETKFRELKDEELRKSIENTDKGFSEFVNGLEPIINNISTDIEFNKNNIKTNKDDINNHENRVILIETKIDGYDAKINNNKRNIEDNTKQITIINDDLALETKDRKDNDTDIRKSIPTFKDWTRLIFTKKFTIEKNNSILVPKLETTFTLTPRETKINGFSFKLKCNNLEINNIYINGNQLYNDAAQTNFNLTTKGGDNKEIHNLVGYGVVPNNLLKLTLWYQNLTKNIDKFYKLQLFTDKTNDIAIIQIEEIFNKLNYE